MNKTRALLGIVVLAVCAMTSAVAQEGEEVLKNADIVVLTDAGLQPEVIVTVIQAKLTDFDVSVAQLAELSRAGVDSSVIQAMVRITADAELVDMIVGAMDVMVGATGENGPVEDEERQESLRAEEERNRQGELERQRLAPEAARRQAEQEAALSLALVAEEEAQQREQAEAMDQYIRLIENRIQQNWIPPASAQAGIQCVVHLTQIPSGDVVDVRIGQCNGDEAVVRSIEAAVLRSSPLPRPPIPSLFDRNLEVLFRPEV